MEKIRKTQREQLPRCYVIICTVGYTQITVISSGNVGIESSTISSSQVFIGNNVLSTKTNGDLVIKSEHR